MFRHPDLKVHVIFMLLRVIRAWLLTAAPAHCTRQRLLGAAPIGPATGTVNGPKSKNAAKKRTLFAKQQHRRFDQLFNLLNEASGVVSVDHAVVAAYRNIH